MYFLNRVMLIWCDSMTRRSPVHLTVDKDQPVHLVLSPSKVSSIRNVMLKIRTWILSKINNCCIRRLLTKLIHSREVAVPNELPNETHPLKGGCPRLKRSHGFRRLVNRVRTSTPGRWVQFYFLFRLNMFCSGYIYSSRRSCSKILESTTLESSAQRRQRIRYH